MRWTWLDGWWNNSISVWGYEPVSEIRMRSCCGSTPDIWIQRNASERYCGVVHGIARRPRDERFSASRDNRYGKPVASLDCGKRRRDNGRHYRRVFRVTATPHLLSSTPHPQGAGCRARCSRVALRAIRKTGNPARPRAARTVEWRCRPQPLCVCRS